MPTKTMQTTSAAKSKPMTAQPAIKPACHGDISYQMSAVGEIPWTQLLLALLYKI